MSHKSIVSMLAGLFCLGVATSVLFFSNVIFYPEFFYALIFALLVIGCIVFFKREDRVSVTKKRPGRVKVADSGVVFFGGRGYAEKLAAGKKAKAQKNLFLKVSIIALVSFFKSK